MGHKINIKKINEGSFVLLSAYA